MAVATVVIGEGERVVTDTMAGVARVVAAAKTVETTGAWCSTTKWPF